MRPRIRGEVEKALVNIPASGTIYIKYPILASEKTIT
jgi:hypothetical protein